MALDAAFLESFFVLSKETFCIKMPQECIRMRFNILFISDIIFIENNKWSDFMKNQDISTVISRKNRNRMKGSNSDFVCLLFMACPALILLLVFNYLPMFGLVMSFKEYNPNLGIWGSRWNGLENFKFFFESQDAVRVLRNTVGYGAVFQITGIVFPMALALFLYEIKSHLTLNVIQTSMILPYFLSMVLVSYITYAVLNPVYGSLNVLLRRFGMSSIDWYSNPKYWPFILTIVNIWKSVGMSSIIYYAALMGIDECLFEAAALDGANKMQIIRYIKVPQLMSVVCILLILGIGNLIGGDFGLFYQVPMDIGALYPATDIINTYVFRGLQQATNLGMTAAVGLFQSVVSLILVVGSNLIVKKIDAESSMF